MLINLVIGSKRVPLSPQPAKMEVVNSQRVSGFFLSMFPNFPIFSGNIWGTFWEHFRGYSNPIFHRLSTLIN